MGGTYSADSCRVVEVKNTKYQCPVQEQLWNENIDDTVCLVYISDMFGYNVLNPTDTARLLVRW